MTATPTNAVPDLAPVVDIPQAGPDAADIELATPESAEPSWAVVAPAPTDDGISVLLVEELQQVADHMAGLLIADAHVRLATTVTEGAAAMDRIAAERPGVVMIDALLQGEVSGLALAMRMRESGMDTPILFLTVPEHPLTLAPDLGTAEVMTLPIEGAILIDTIKRLDRAQRGTVRPNPTGTVAVFSAKGGAGRTAIAHNLAVAMSQSAETRVVLVDGDQVHGDLRLHLEAPENAPSLLQLPTGHVTDADVAPLLWRDATGLDILLAPPRMEQADLIMLADVRRAHHTLRQMFDLVVLDVPAVMDDKTMAILDDADIVLDVTTPKHGAVRKTQRCHAVLTAADFPMDKILTVVNHADADFDSAEFAEELGWAPDAVLMHDERLASGSVPAGSSIVTAYPDSLFSRGFKDLAALLSVRIEGGAGHLAARAA